MNHSLIHSFTRIVLSGVYDVLSQVALRLLCYFHNLILVRSEIMRISQMCRERKTLKKTALEG